MSSCSRAAFIFSCSGISLSDRTAGVTLGGNMYILATSGVFGMVGWSKGECCEGCWGCHLVWPPMGGVCVRVATGTEMAESVSFSLRGSSIPSVDGGALRATNAGSLLGILCWETGVEAAEEAHCSHSKAPWRCSMMTMAMSQGGSIVSARGWVSTGVVVGA